MRKCEGMNPLEILLIELHERKIDFNDEQLKKIWFDQACLDLEYSALPETQENIQQRMCRYATDVLMVADELYKKYDRNFKMGYDADGNYWITDNGR